MEAKKQEQKDKKKFTFSGEYFPKCAKMEVKRCRQYRNWKTDIFKCSSSSKF